MTLPFAAEADDAEILRKGVVAFDNQNGSTTVPIIKSDGSIQITTVIELADSPTSYTYDLRLQEGARLVEEEDGGVVMIAPDGSFIGGIAAPWATAADGKSVPTEYTIDGHSLTQTVHHSPASTAYPVVADPWLFIDLIERTSWNGNTLRVYPTFHGRTTGVASRWAGWDEVLNKTPGNRENTPSMRDQYYCHVDFVRIRAPRKESWNLDLNRPHISYPDLIAKQCNA